MDIARIVRVAGLVALCSAVLAGVSPAGYAAEAVSSASRGPSSDFFYVGGDGEENVVSLVNAESGLPGQMLLGPDVITVLDSGPGVVVTTRGCIPLVIGAACSSAVRDTGGALPDVGVRLWGQIVIRLGDRADRLTVRGFEADVPLSVEGGAGDDFIDVRNENAERVSCGPGLDTVLANSHDAVLDAPGECEHVVRDDCLPIVIGCEVEELLPARLTRR